MECQNFAPFTAGMKAALSAADAGLSALAAACRGAAVTRNLSGNSRLFAGTLRLTFMSLAEQRGRAFRLVIRSALTMFGDLPRSAMMRWRCALL